MSCRQAPGGDARVSYGHGQRDSSKAQAAFQRGLTALTQWVEREGGRPVPRGHSEQITVDGEAEPVVMKLGV
uniref:hypothetical protein n=1 Tax=Streptomyces sp. WI03-5b TaxID=462946 RepID=UPI0039F4C75C